MTGLRVHTAAVVKLPARAAPIGRRENNVATSTPLTRHRLLRPARLPFRHSPAAKSSAGVSSRVPSFRGPVALLDIVLVRSMPFPLAILSRPRSRIFDEPGLEALVVGPEQPFRGGLGSRTRGGVAARRSGTAGCGSGHGHGTAAGHSAAKSRSRRPRTLAPVVAHRSQRLLDLLGQHRLRQRLGGASEDGSLATSEGCVAVRPGRRTRCHPRRRRPCPDCA